MTAGATAKSVSLRSASSKAGSSRASSRGGAKPAESSRSENQARESKKRIVVGTRERAERALAEVDWAKIDSLTDEDIAKSIAEDPDTFDASTIAEEDWQIHYPLPNLKAVRQKLGISQKDFALTFRISKRTLENWEQGRRTIDGVGSVYLTLVANFPREMAKLLKEIDRADRRKVPAAAE